MQSSRNLVTFAVKFTSGMERCHNGLQSRNFCLFVNIDRNTSAIVNHANPVVPIYMPGRLRTGSSPSKTVMDSALYAPVFLTGFFDFGICILCAHFSINGP